MTPIVLHYVGTYAYGVFALASIFIGFLSALDLGMGAAATKYIAAAQAADDRPRTRAIVQAGIGMLGIVGLVGCGGAILVGTVLLDPLFHITPSVMSDARFVFIVAGVGFFFNMLQAAMSAIPAALERYDIVGRVGFVLTTASTLATIAVLAAGAGIRGMVVVTTAQAAAAAFVYARIARHMLPGIRPAPAFDSTVTRELIRFGGLAFIGNLAGVILFQLDKILLGALGNARQVSYYVVPGNIAQRVHTAAAAMAAVVMPATSALETRGDDTRVQQLYAGSVRFVTVFVVTIVVPMFVLAGDLLDEWVGDEFNRESFTTLRVLLFTYGLLALGAPAYFALLGRGRPAVTTLFNCLMAVVNVPLVIVLIPRAGSEGAAWAYLFSVLPVAGLIAYGERRIVKVSRSPWPGVTLRLVVPTLASVGLLMLVRERITSVGVLAATLVAGCAVIAGGYLAMPGSGSDRDVIRTLVTRGRHDTTA